MDETRGHILMVFFEPRTSQVVLRLVYLLYNSGIGSWI